MKRLLLALAFALAPLAPGAAAAADPIQPEESASVALGSATLATVATIGNRASRLLCLHFEVSGAALSEFKVYARAHLGGALIDFTPADWTALNSGSRIRRAARSSVLGALVDGNLNAVAAAQNGYVELDIDGLVEIVIRATGSGAVVAPRWSKQ